MRTRSSLRTWCRAAIAVGLIGAATAARAQEQIEYYGTDVLGSIRIVFDAAGTVKGRMDFAPFGGSVQTGSGVGDKVFAQLSFDGETGLDYAQARMYEATTGRFYAPDPLYAGLFAPQGWNRYAYALNNPVRFADPSGLEVGPCNPPRPNCWASGNDPGGNDPGVSPPSESPSEGTSDFFLRDELCWTWHLCGADPSTYSFGGVFGGIAGLPGLPEVPPPQAPPPQAPPLVHPLPPNTPKSDEKAFNSAYSNAYQRLQSSRCGNLYGGSGIATQTMSNIMYRFQNLGSASYQGGVYGASVARTISAARPQVVIINSQGPFTKQRIIVPNAPTVVHDFSGGMNPSDFGALMLLHELGHARFIFGPDSNNQQLIDTYTGIVRNLCF